MRAWIPRVLVMAASLAAGAVAVLFHAGCHRSASPAPATVRGTVTFQGQPLAGGLIVFTPDPDRGGSGKSARGEIRPDGGFQLRHADSATIPPGWYRVAIAPSATTPGTDGSTGFPPQLCRPDQSGLLREVRPWQDHVFDFAVELN